MKIQRSYILVFLVVLLGIVSYLFFFYQPSPLENNVKEKAAGAPSQKSKINFKSVIVTMKSTSPVMGSEVETKIYIDNYGEKYCSVTETKMSYKNQPVVTTEISLVKNGFTYTYDPEKKTGTKSINATNFNPTKIDFSGLDENALKDHGIERAGNETILGKDCEVYTVNYPALKMSSRYDVWETIPLRSKTQLGDTQIEMIATKVEENVPIAEAVFNVPEDVRFTFPVSDTAKVSSLSPSRNQ